MTERTSPLDATHRDAGAKFAPFGGWRMPIQYRGGVLAEHRACREDAAVFDVSHLGSVRVVGGNAREGLQRTFTNDLARIAPGRAQYTHLLDPDDAHVVDDVIVWWLADDEFVVMPNASNTQPLLDALSHAVGEGSVEDVTGTRAVLAVQGPKARTVLAAVAPGLASVGRFAVSRERWGDHDCIVAGTGYTGEDGVEIHVPTDGAGELWDAMIAAGVVPAGLGARDTLRLEMGYPLHGHELGPGITPLQARLDWVVRFDKGDFQGRAPLLAERERGPARLLWGLAVDGRQVPRSGYAVLASDRHMGEVTSGNFSPTLGRSIALAFLRPGLSAGAEVAVDVRGQLVPATVVDPPFIDRR